jgi:plasmid stabilization system protein ParE
MCSINTAGTRNDRTKNSLSGFEPRSPQKIAIIRDNPKIGPPCSIPDQEFVGIRYFRVEPPFDKFLLFYRATRDTLQVVRVLHGMRDLPRRLKEK